MNLAGRVAIITGASMGLGAEIAERFVAAGAAVMLCARSNNELESQRMQIASRHPNARIEIQVVDIADEKQVDLLFNETLRAFGTFDILVNNAGVYGPMGSIDAVDWGDWVKAVTINLTGTVYCSRKAVVALRKKGYGKIINLSGGGATNPLPGISAYAASKAAIVRFTETLALEVKADKIDVNAVAPGALATRLTDQLLEAGPEKVGEGLYARMKKIKAEGGTPLGVGADLCVYLASADSDGVTGRLIAGQWDPWPFADAVKQKLSNSDIYTLRRIVPADRGENWER